MLASNGSLTCLLPSAEGRALSAALKAVAAKPLALPLGGPWTTYSPIPQDKAEDELLARSAPRTLKLGLMAAAVGHLLILGPILNRVREMWDHASAAACFVRSKSAQGYGWGRSAHKPSTGCSLSCK